MNVRQITADESEQFLQLLCDVFGLDYPRAQGIFFNEPMFDLQRKWALFDGAEMVSILTTVPLHFGWGNAIGIAGVATRPQNQGKGHAGRLLEAVLQASAERGEPSALLFARETGLYERAGFERIDDVIRGEIVGAIDEPPRAVLEYDDVKLIYERWAEGHAARLRRDERRWKYWRWTFRMCSPIADGYACLEGNILRECVSSNVPSRWPIGRGAHWLGTRSMARLLGLELLDPQFDLYLMGFNIPVMPQMFMTDQF